MATSQETNSSHYEIERTTDAKKWETIGTVSASINSSLNKAYEFLDLNPHAAENLYRLKMIDQDGTFAYSNIRAVVFDHESLIAIIYPNPVANRLFLDQKNTSDIKGLTIYNASGVAVSSFGKYFADGISVRDLPSGVYVLLIKTIDGRSLQNKFIKH